MVCFPLKSRCFSTKMPLTGFLFITKSAKALFLLSFEDIFDSLLFPSPKKR